MSTTFNTFVNNVYATLASAHSSGATTLALGSGQGSQFGAMFPMLVTVIKYSTYRTTNETLCIFTVTGRTGDTLIVSAIRPRAPPTRDSPPAISSSSASPPVRPTCYPVRSTACKQRLPRCRS